MCNEALGVPLLMLSPVAVNLPISPLFPVSRTRGVALVHLIEGYSFALVVAIPMNAADVFS